MAAHGIALWGNKGNTAYFSYAAFIFTLFIVFFAFFCCIDKFYVTSYLPKALLYSTFCLFVFCFDFAFFFLYMTYRSLNLKRIKNVHSLQANKFNKIEIS